MLLSVCVPTLYSKSRSISIGKTLRLFEVHILAQVAMDLHVHTRPGHQIKFQELLTGLVSESWCQNLLSWILSAILAAHGPANLDLFVTSTCAEPVIRMSFTLNLAFLELPSAQLAQLQVFRRDWCPQLELQNLFSEAMLSSREPQVFWADCAKRLSSRYRQCVI